MTERKGERAVGRRRPLRQATKLRSTLHAVLLALLLASTVLAGRTVHASLQLVTDPTTAFAYWTRLPGDRALWFSKRPACSPTLTSLGCRFAGLTTDARLRIIYYPPEADPMEHTIRVPRREPTPRW